MAGVVDGVQLLLVAGHTYRQRTQPIDSTSAGSSRGRGRRQQQQQQLDWQAAEDAELLAAAEEQQQQEHDPGDSTAADNGSEDGRSIQQCADGSWMSEIRADPQLFGYVIGRGGANKQEIEAATGCRITCGSGRGPPQQQQQRRARPLPLSSTHSEPITIRGPSRGAVASAATRVQLQLDSVTASRLLDFNFFLSVPLPISADAAQRLQAFQDELLQPPAASADSPAAAAAASGLDKSIFIDPSRLHLTLVMLKLFSDDARHRAAATLQSLRPKVDALLAGSPLEIRLRGLDWMGDDPTDVNVLYLKVEDEGGRLAALCDLAVAAFDEAGLLVQPPQHQQKQQQHQQKQQHKVKLHATIINTRHRRQQREDGQQQQQQQRRQQQQRQGFDGTAVLKQHGNLDLGFVPLRALAISQRGVYDQASGHYAALDTLPLAV